MQDSGHNRTDGRSSMDRSEALLDVVRRLVIELHTRRGRPPRDGNTAGDARLARCGPQ